VSADIRVSEDPATEVAELLTEAAEAGGHLVLTGGSSPERAYELAAERDADWSSATVWFTDERCVPPSHPDSNFGMAERALLSRLTRPPRAMRIEGELGHEAAAGAYEALLREHLGPDPRFDLILLGMGPDSHVASLFPGKPELEETRRLVVGVPIAGLEPQVPRVTLTLPVLNRGREVDFLVSGAGKAQAVARAFGDPPDPEAPAARVRPQDGSLFVFVDEAAAAAL
jgi:6-phosphogluconolactonase